MAYRNKVLVNPRTGQTIRFLQTGNDTGGRFLEMESAFAPGSKQPPLHYHPHQDEFFSILSGKLTVNLNGHLKTYTTGDRLHIPTNVVHAMWNESAHPAVVNWQVSPALNTENFLEILMGLAAEGRTNERGMPGLLEIALIAHKFDNIFRLARPSFLVQKMVFFTLIPIAFVLGYKSFYHKYVD
jgi:quercetin dioxygenase-like cupin family protein